MQNIGRKDSDIGVFSGQNGMETDFPGIAIEVGKADDLSKIRIQIFLHYLSRTPPARFTN